MKVKCDCAAGRDAQQQGKHVVKQCGQNPAQRHYYGPVIAPFENHVQSTAQERDYPELNSCAGFAGRRMRQYLNADQETNGCSKQRNENNKGANVFVTPIWFRSAAVRAALSCPCPHSLFAFLPSVR